MPPAANPLAGVRAKLKRAKQHVADFDRVYGRFVEQHGDMVAMSEDVETGKRIYYLLWDNPDATEFALWIGDVAHNLRSALDHLAYALCVAGPGGSVVAHDARRRIQFPITSGGAQEYKALAHRTTVVALSKPGVEQVLDATEPYAGGKGEALSQISALDNADKHRLLVTVALNNARTNPTATLARTFFESYPQFAGRIMFDSFDISPLVRRPQIAGREFKAGSELFRESLDQKPKYQEDFVADITLNEPDITTPQSVLPLLVHYTQHVEGVVDAFTGFV